MDQVKYQRQASGAQFTPTRVSNANVNAIAREGERVIRGMERQRDSEQRERTRVLDAMRRNATTEAQVRETQFDLDTQANRVSRTVMDMDLRTAEANATREADRNEKIFKSLSKLSQTATDQYVKVAQDRFDKDYLDELNRTLLEGPDLQSLDEYQAAEANLNIAGQVVEVEADIMEANGTPSDVVEQTRDLNSARRQGREKALAIMAGNSWKDWAESELQTNTQFQVEIPGPDGTKRTITPSQARTAAEKRAVLQAMFPIYLQMNGLYGMSPEALNPTIMRIRDANNQIIGDQRDADARAGQQNRIETALTRLSQTKSQQDYSNLVREYQRSRDQNGNILTPSEAAQKAAASVMNAVDDSGQPLYSDEDIENFGNLPAEGSDNKQPISKRFPWWNRMLQERRNRINSDNQILETERQNAIELQGRQVLQDFEDGTIDLTKANVEAAIEQAKQLGDTKTARRLEAMLQTTPSMVQREQQKDELQALLNRGLLTRDRVIFSKLTEQEKSNLLGQLNSQGGPVSEAQSETSFSVIEASLKAKIKDSFTPDGQTTIPSYYRAKAAAEDAWRRAYTMARRDGKTEQQAIQEADSQFQRDLDNGVYQVIDEDDDNGGSSFKNFGQDAAETDVPTGRIKAALEEDPDSVNTTVYVPRSELDSVQRQFDKGGRVVMPDMVEYIASNLRDADGKIPNTLEILDAQLKAAGLAGVPEKYLTQASEILDQIDPDLQPYLTYKPSAVRTRVAYNGNGTPTYQTLSYTSQQRQALDIIGQFEGGPWGYNSVNQGGADDGRTAIGSGTYSQKPGSNGRQLTDLTVAEIMQLQSDDGSLSDAQWQAAGKLWAVGKYQFIPDTLNRLIQEFNIPTNVKFSAELQDFLALKLLSQDGYAPWVGVVDKASPDQIATLMVARRQQVDTPVWRQPQNMNPRVVYRTAGEGNTSTGPHLDVKREDGSRFEPSDLDAYVRVRDPEYGEITLSELQSRIPGVGDNFDEHVARGSHGIDFPTATGSEIVLTGGARRVGSIDTEHGDLVTIETPDGTRYTFLHGKAA